MLKSPEYLSTRRDQRLPELVRRFLCRTLIEVAQSEPYLAFSQMLCAAWVADDSKLAELAMTFRLSALKYLGDNPQLNLPQRMQFLNVLRRVGAWDQASDVANGLKRGWLDCNLKAIVAFQSTLITRRDQACHKIDEAFPKSSYHLKQDGIETRSPTSLAARLRSWFGWLE